jgi:hypothetical protein
MPGIQHTSLTTLPVKASVKIISLKLWLTQNCLWVLLESLGWGVDVGV